MGTPSHPLGCLQKKYLFIITRSHPQFDDDPSWLEHLRDFIEVVVEKIYNEPAVRALGRSRSELAFRIFWVLAPQYERYEKRQCPTSKGDVFTDIFCFLQDLQRLYPVGSEPGSRSSSQPHTSPIH